MIKHPKTIEEARLYKYNRWAGNPNGTKYIEGNCAYEVRFYISGWPHCHQCYRHNGYGLTSLYCKQHFDKIKERRDGA